MNYSHESRYKFGLKSKIFALCLVCLTSLTAVAETVSNGLVTLSFEEATGSLFSFKDETRRRELLNGNGGPLWLIRMKDGSLCIPDKATHVETTPVALGLDINWYMPDGICVTAWVRLDENSSLVRWRLKVKASSNFSHAGGQLSISEIQFPIISGILPCTDVLGESGAADEDLAVSTWLGSLIHSPRSGVNRERPRVSFSWQSPGSLSMQRGDGHVLCLKRHTLIFEEL